ENRRAAHAIQWFENDIAVFLMEGFQQVGTAGDDGGGHQLREGGGKDFFVTIAQALRLVGDQYAFLLGTFQYIGAVNKLAVERRVFTHQDNVQAVQRQFLPLAQIEPVVGIHGHGKLCHAAHGATVLNRQVALFHVPEFAAALLGCVQQSQRGVLLEVNGGDRVHHHTDFDGHSGSVITRCVVRYVVLVAQCTSVIVL